MLWTISTTNERARNIVVCYSIMFSDNDQRTLFIHLLYMARLPNDHILRYIA